MGEIESEKGFEIGAPSCCWQKIDGKECQWVEEDEKFNKDRKTDGNTNFASFSKMEKSLEVCCQFPEGRFWWDTCNNEQAEKVFFFKNFFPTQLTLVHVLLSIRTAHDKQQYNNTHDNKYSTQQWLIWQFCDDKNMCFNHEKLKGIKTTFFVSVFWLAWKRQSAQNSKRKEPC